MPLVVSAIVQHSAAMKEKTNDRLMLPLFSNAFTLLEKHPLIRRLPRNDPANIL
jgi:hypothetical protein